MKIEKISDTITEIDGVVRIEPGPVRRRAVATKELFDAAELRDHYHLPYTKDNGDVVVAVDSMGAPIEEGKEFDYIDWNGDGVLYYIYKKDGDDRWVSVGAEDTYEAAISAASGHLEV